MYGLGLVILHGFRVYGRHRRALLFKVQAMVPVHRTTCIDMFY